MAANTFLECTRSLRLYVPQLPITLAEQFIRDRYRRILERRNWSALRAEGEFHLLAERSDGTVDVTLDSNAVTGNTTTFAATDVGRQFKVGVGSPIYTITAVNTLAQTLTLDRNFGGATASATSYRIFSGYVTPPSDFLQFEVITDPVQGWRLRHWITATELSAMDPQRTFFGQPYLLADRLFSASGIPQYEAWPYTTTARTLYYVYHRRGDDLTADDDIPIWPMRSDAIVSGALADVVRWPGTQDNPNPYFQRPDYWRSYEAEFEDKMIEIERRDEDVYSTMLEQWPYHQQRLAPLSANFIQSHVV